MQPENQAPINLPRSDVAPSMKPHLPSHNSSGDVGRLLEPGESLVTVLHRHPIGIVGYYIEAFVGIFVVMGFLIFLAVNLKDSLGGNASVIIAGGSILALAVMVFFLFVATYVYRQCRIIVTDRSLVQVMQKSLFIRKVSRLSLTNVEDVSAESRGILASMFGYGTLLIQTAGTLENFEFSYCPDPTRYADQIIEARESYAASLEEEQGMAMAENMAHTNQ